jgi:hypothetical protein
MVTNASKKIVEDLLKLVYQEQNIISYEQDLIEIMIDSNCTLSEAIEIDFDVNSVDKKSVIDMVDYLEYKLVNDLYKIDFLMKVYTGNTADFKLEIS